MKFKMAALGIRKIQIYMYFFVYISIPAADVSYCTRESRFLGSKNPLNDMLSSCNLDNDDNHALARVIGVISTDRTRIRSPVELYQEFSNNESYLIKQFTGALCYHFKDGVHQSPHLL